MNKYYCDNIDQPTIILDGTRVMSSGEIVSKLNNLEQATSALIKAYRKHTLADPDIGWDELTDIMCDSLCELIGDDGFQELKNSE